MARMPHPLVIIGRDQAIKVETALKADQVVLLVHGGAQDEAQAPAMAGIRS